VAPSGRLAVNYPPLHERRLFDLPGPASKTRKTRAAASSGRQRADPPAQL